MDEELKKLLTLSTKSVTGLTDSLKKESVGESNIKAAVEDQTSSETGLLEDIKNTLQNAFKQQVKTDKEKEFESKKAKKPSPAAVKKVTQPIVNFVSPIAKTLGTILKSLAAAILALIAIMNAKKLKEIGEKIINAGKDVVDFVKDNALGLTTAALGVKALGKTLFGGPKGTGATRRVLREGMEQIPTKTGTRFRNTKTGRFVKAADAFDDIPAKRVNFFVKNFGKGSKFGTFFDDFFKFRYVKSLVRSSSVYLQNLQDLIVCLDILYFIFF